MRLANIASVLSLAALAGAVAVPSPQDPGAVPPPEDLGPNDLLPPPTPLDNAPDYLKDRPVPAAPQTYVLNADLLRERNTTYAPPGPAYVDGVANNKADALVDSRFDAMGRLHIFLPDGKGGWTTTWCSGSLVGPRLVATARHCLFAGARYTFSPNYDRGDQRPLGDVVGYWEPTTRSDEVYCKWKPDWVLMKLDKPLGGSHYLGVATFQEDKASPMNEAIFETYGYPHTQDEGKLPLHQDRRRVGSSVGDILTAPACPAGPPLISDAWMVKGQSGAPVYYDDPVDGKGPVQVGVQVAFSLDTHDVSFVAHGFEFVTAVNMHRND